MAEEAQTSLPLDTPAATPAVAEKPVEAAPVAEAAAAEPKIELTSDKPSLLETVAEAKPEEKPAEVKAEEKVEAKPEEKAETKVEAKPEAKAEEAKTEEKPAEAKTEPAKLEPVAYEYALPETIKLDDASRSELYAALDAFRADNVKGAQGLIDLHNKSMQQYADSLLAKQHETFNATRDQWRKDVMADDQIGGAGHQTSMKAIARMRDLFVSNSKPGSKQYESDMANFSQFLRITGAGDHPAFLKMLHNAARYFDEPALPPDNPRPPPDNGRAPGGRRATMYDHPRSNLNRQ